MSESALKSLNLYEGSENGTDSGEDTMDQNEVKPTGTKRKVRQRKSSSKVLSLVSYQNNSSSSSDNERDNEKILKECPVVKEMNEENIMEDYDLIPQEPAGDCSQDLQDKIVKLGKKMETESINPNDLIQMRKDFRNPSIYSKLVSFCNIDEMGSNFDNYDPQKWKEEPDYLELRRRQNCAMDKLERERKTKDEMTIKKSGERGKKKSQWNESGTRMLNRKKY